MATQSALDQMTDIELMLIAMQDSSRREKLGSEDRDRYRIMLGAARAALAVARDILERAEG